jgi:hypothetical protein
MGNDGFYLYTKDRKNKKPIYHAKFKQPGGSYISRSTKKTSEEAAARWAQEQIDRRTSAH